MKTGALILASHSLQGSQGGSEEFAPFLPMLALEGTSVIKRQINTLRAAGLTPIYVLGGHLSDTLRIHLSHKGIIFLTDPLYEKADQRQSLEYALSQIFAVCDSVVSVPVEYPMFSEETVRRLLQEGRPARAVYQGKGALRLHVKGCRPEDEPSGEWVLKTEDEGLAYCLLDPGAYQQVQEYAGRVRSSSALRCHVKLVLSREEDFFGPGILRLMALIEESGSIQAAASMMEMSYSKAWKMVNKAEKQLGFALVARLNGGRNGGSSHLTEEGRVFMQRYDAMLRDLEKTAGSFFDVYFSEFQ